MVWLGQQPRGRSDDPVDIGAHDLRDTGRDRLGPLGHLAHDQHRLAQRGRFFLDTAAIGQHEMRRLHQRDHLHVIDGRNEVDRRGAAESFLNHALDLRVEVDGVDDLRIAALCNHADRVANPRETVAKTLAPMAGDEHQFLSRVKLEIERGKLIASQAVCNMQQRINAGIAGHFDLPCRVTLGWTFGAQILHRRAGGCPQQIRHRIDGNAVIFLRPRTLDIVAAQSCLNMADGDAGIECGKRGGHG